MATAAAVVACALVLLGRPLHSMPTLVFLEQPPPGNSPNAEAFVAGNPDTIYLITSSAVFRAALAAQPECSDRAAQVKLASILAHELWHVANGSDEQGAYTAQLVTLAWLGVHPNDPVYGGVQGSMKAAVKGQKARRDLNAGLPQARSWR
jgi:hypothetical protein